MKSRISLYLCRRNVYPLTALLLSFSLITMPFVQITLASSEARRQVGNHSSGSRVTIATEKQNYRTNPNAAVPAPAPEPLVPTITATKVDALIADDGDNKADPGGTEKIEYTITITNNGTDAADVVFSDDIDDHTTLVPGSINTQPIADPDTYTASGNIGISIAAPGVLANDRDPDTGNNSGLTVTQVQGSAANVGVATDTTATGRAGVKGKVTLNANGGFTYEPAPGFVGDDTFTYQTSDGTKTDTAEVKITISNMVWFISNNVGGSNLGTFSNPFTSIASFNTANAGTGVAPDPKNGDFISLRTGTGTYNETDGVNLRAQQRLIGNAVQFNTVFAADANSIAAYTTFASAAAAAPTISTSNGNGVDLASDNTVRGFNVGNVAGAFAKFNGTAVGNLVLNTVSTSGTGAALNVSTSGAFGSNVTFDSLASSSATGIANVNLVNVTGTLAATAGGAGLTNGIALPVVNISGGSVNFSYPGSVARTAGTGTLVSVSGGHTGTLAFVSVSGSAGGGVAFDNADGSYSFSTAFGLTGGTAGISITNGSSGTFNWAAVAAISGIAGVSFNVGSSPGNPNVTYSGTITHNNAGTRAVNVDGTTGGSIGINAVTAGSTAGGVGNTGININNANGSVAFTTVDLGTSGTRMTQTALTITGGSGAISLGTIDIFTTGTAQGIAGSNGSGSITNNSASTINTLGAAAVNIDGPAGRTPLNLQFTSINTSGGSNGIVLTDTSSTGSPGGFRVLGTATGSDRCGGFIDTTPVVDTIINPVSGECSGGRITGTTGAGDGTPSDNSGIGVRLVNANSVVLQRMRIDGHSNIALYGNNVNGFTLNNSLIDGTNGDDAATDDNAISFDNLLGSATISSSSISGGHEDNLDVENSTGTLDRLTISNTNFGSQSNLFGEDGLVFSSTGNPTMKLTVTSCRFQHGRSDLLQSVARDTSTLETIILNSIFDNDHPNTLSGGGGIVIEADAAGDAPTHTFNVSGNTFRDALGVAVNIFKGTGSGSMSGTINGNTIGVSGVTDSGSVQGSGISVDGNGNGTVTVAITNNTIRQYGSGDGINLNAGNSETDGALGDHSLNATVTGNTIEQPGTFGSNAFELNGGTNTGNANNICLDLQNNTMENGGSVPNFEDDVNLRQRFDSIVRMPGYTGGSKDTTAVQTYIANRNPGAETVIASASANPAPSGYFNTNPAGSACAAAAAPTAPLTFTSMAANILPVDPSTSIAVREFKPASPITPARVLANTGSAQQQVAQRVVNATAPAKSRKVVSHHPNLRRNNVRVAAPSFAAVSPAMSGENVSRTIGTLRAGDSVTITFEVTVDNPPNLTLLNPPRVSNQGTVSGSNFSNVLTDDPAVGGASDPTETPVDLFDTTTTLVSDLNPSDFGDTVTFTATVAENPAQGSVDPTGTVDFIDTSNGNAVVCDDVALSGGSAQCQTSTLTPGTHNIRADYSGDGNFDPSQSNVVEQIVNACTQDPVVTTTADAGAGSLREALSNVCSGDTITFNIPDAGPHTITLTSGELLVDQDVTVNNNSGESITVSGNNLSRVFNVDAGITAAIIGLTISGGNSTSDGGAIINNGALTIVNSTLSGNTTSSDGGAISTTATGTSLTLINTTVSGNSAGGSGGGFIVLGGTATSVNSTITNNVADSDNGGNGDGGGIRAHAGTTTLKNTIVAGNFNENGATDAADDISGTVDAASSFNLIGAGGAGSLVHGVNNNQVGVADAGLGALASNGGTTQTHALLPTSPAVEAGGNANLPADAFDLDGDTDMAETLPVDQRGTGFPRTADSQDANTTQTVDIGAFELHPSIEDIPDQTTAEDTPKMVTFNLGDDTGALIDTVTATSSNTALVASDGAHLSFTGSGGSRTLTITPNTDANSLADGGTTTITVTVTATNGRTAVDTFDLTVTEVNDNPDAVNDSLTAIDEDSGVRIIPFADLLGNDTAGPANESGQTLTVTNVSNPVGGTVVINGMNVEFTPTANFSGSASFDYTATDNGTTNGVSDPKSDTATASFTINAINDPPSFTKGADQTVDEDAGPQSVPGWATDISAGPNEIQNLTFNVSVTGTTGNLAFSSAPAIDATTGTLTYTTAADTNGTANLSVTLSDDGSNTPPNSNTSAAQTFTITVNAVNDAPTFQLGANPSIAEDAGPQTINGFAFNFQPGPATATDESSQTLVGYTVTQTGSSGGLTFNAAPAIDNSGTLTFTADNDSSGTATFDVVATDSGSGTPPNVNQSAPVSFTITVGATNDPPVNTVPGPQGTNQNTPLTFSSGNGNQISVADADAGTNAIQVTLTATNGTITLNGTTGLSFSFSDGNGTGTGDGTADPTMTFRGTLTAINTALNGMTFTPTPGFSGAASLTITSNDLGNTGSGGPQTDTDVVNIQVSTNISIQDAQVAEPTSGSVNMIFTVSLSAPAPAGGTSVNFTTVQQMPAISHATAGIDYTTTSGTVNFAMGEQIKTIEVPVLADSQAGEANETFLVELSNPVNGTIADGSATGTILVMNQPGAILISELRTSGPGGAGDDFVEIYNNSDSPHTVAATDSSAGYGLFKMGAACGDTPVLIGVIPNGTVIPARGHFLIVGSAYSLTAYSAGNLTMSSDIENDRNVGIFSTSALAAISSANRFDAVGFGTNTGGTCDLLREGTTLTPMVGSVLEHSYFRDECGKGGNPATFGACPTGGATQDTNVNASDFIFADTTAAATPAGQRLGAPGPQGIGSPAFKSTILALLLDATKGASAAPNRFRDTTPQGPNAQNGTLTVVRRFFNNTGAPVTQLRFRIVDFSTIPTNNADLRALDSVTASIGGVNDSATCLASTGSPAVPCTVQVHGTTLEQPPTQAMGGANNSSWNAGTITLGTPLAPGASVNLQFRLGVQATGAFKFFFNIEALP